MTEIIRFFDHLERGIRQHLASDVELADLSLRWDQYSLLKPHPQPKTRDLP